MGKEYTEEQTKNILSVYSSIEEMERFTALQDARQYLADTDYIIIKIQEYSITGQEVDNDYTEILQKREEAREVIRKLEV